MDLNYTVVLIWNLQVAMGQMELFELNCIDSEFVCGDWRMDGFELYIINLEYASGDGTNATIWIEE